MAEVADPPAAPAPAPAAAPAPTHVNLTEPAAVPTTPAKPGSARERMQRDVAKKMNLEEPPARAPERTGDKPPAAPDKAEAPRPGETTSPEPPADVSPEQKKQNPWKLYKAEKARAEGLERQMAESKTGTLADTEKAQYLERIEKAEAKLKTYEDEIRFKSYEKSDEFKTKYEQPYEKAWSKHMHDLRGVTVLDDGGASRAMEAKDILDLVNLELPDARKLATEKWGDFAQDAMLARKEIRDLFESKNTALEEARKTGSEREKQMQERGQKWQANTTKHIKETWETANQEALSHPTSGEFFKPVEGDPKRNEILTKGFQRVDAAFAKNPMDPKLTPEQRAQAVREHAAVRNKSAGFDVLKLINRRLMEKVAALEKANGEFKGSEPPRAGGTSTTGAPASTSARERMRSVGDKWAK